MTDYLWLDLETTGLNPKTCRVIEVACLLTKDDISSFKTYAEGNGVKKFRDNEPAHRAMQDIQNSQKELAYYLSEIKKLP